MKKIICPLLFLALALSLYADENKREAKSPEELKNIFIEYHKSKNIDGLISLFCADNTPEEMNPGERRRKIFTEYIQYEIKSIEIADLSEEDKARYSKGTPYKGGTLYWINLEPLKKLSVTYNDPKGIRKLEEIIGKKGSAYLFCNPALKNNMEPKP